MEALRQAGIEFEVIPGVTSALGAAASARISLTDRRHSSRVSSSRPTAQANGSHERTARDCGRRTSFTCRVIVMRSLPKNCKRRNRR